MTFALPSLADLGRRVREAFRAEMPGADAYLWPNNVAVSAKVIALSCYEHFLRLGWLYRQIFAATADGEHLDRHAAEYGLARKGASFAEGYADWTGIAGTPVASGTQILRSDGISLRVTDNAVIGAAGTVTLHLRAEATGPAANTIAGAPLALAESFSGIDDAGAVSDAGIGSGTTAETDDELRQRVLFRKRNTPMGGAPSDYMIWAFQRPGVTRVTVERLAYGLGTVGVWFMMDDSYAAGQSVALGVPLMADVEAMKDYLDDLAPATAIVCVMQPSPVFVDIVIKNLDPWTSAVRDAIAAEIADMFRRRGEIGRASAPYTFSRSWIAEAISAATGENRHILVAPVADVVLARGAVAIPGTITWQG